MRNLNKEQKRISNLLLGKEFSLCALSNSLTELGFNDIFDGDVKRDCLNENLTKGEWCDIEGEICVLFDVIELADDLLDVMVKVTAVDLI